MTMLPGGEKTFVIVTAILTQSMSVTVRQFCHSIMVHLHSSIAW